MIYVLFGPPGVGKTYVGTLLSEQCKAKFLDTDDLYSPEEIELVRTKKFDNEAKKRFVVKVVDRIKSMESGPEDVVLVAGAFTTEESRKMLLRLTESVITFIRIEAGRETGMLRARKRLEMGDHIITEAILKRQWDLFEEPSFSYKQIFNENQSDQELLQQFTSLI